MMSSDSNSKGGTGRGLPVGWGWREDEDGFAVRLYPPGCGSLDYSAAVYRDGSFVAYRDARGSDEIASEDRASRSSEAIAAAQREAEAALWAHDGFGVGEVRGRVLTCDQYVAVILCAPTALPGLPGVWRVTAVRPVEGGIEVDAVRAPVEPAPVIEAGPFCEWALCRAPLSGPARPGCGSPYMHKGEPAPREPSAPTPDASAELAALLLALRPAIPLVLGWFSVSSPAYRLARAVELLLAERARRSRADAAEQFYEALRGRDAEIVALRARADEAERKLAAWHTASGTTAPADVLALARAGDALLDDAERERDAQRGRVAELERLYAAERGAVVAFARDTDEAHAALERAGVPFAVIDERADWAARKIVALRGRVDEQVKEIAGLYEQIDTARAKLRVASAGVEDVWKWAGDGEDHPESMGCPVVMSAETLREFVAATERAEALESRVEEAERKLDDVAALQRTTAADLDAARAQLRIVQAGREDVWHWQGDGRDDPASLSCPVVMSAETLRGLLAAPPPAAAGLLAAVEQAAKPWRSVPSDFAYDPGKAHANGRVQAYEEAASLITAHLGGAPSPLARVAAEVCARAEGFADQRYPGAWLELARETADSQDGNHRLNALECAGLCLRTMLACDAAPVDGTKGGARG